MKKKWELGEVRKKLDSIKWDVQIKVDGEPTSCCECHYCLKQTLLLARSLSDLFYPSPESNN